MLDEVINSNAERLKLKERLENSYLSDANIPLRERWETWREMSQDLKNHSELVDRAISEAYASFKGYDRVSWYDEMNMDRYQTMDIADIVDYAYEDVWDEIGGDGVEEHEADILIWKVPRFRTLVEFVLSSNTGTMVYDL